MSEANIAVDDLPRPPGESESEASERVRVQEHLREAYGVESMFVRVKTLSRILGIAPATLRASMRAGRFTLPHVVVCSAPLVRTDQLIDWILALNAGARAPAPSSTDDEGEQAGDSYRDSLDVGASGRTNMRRLRKRLVAETLAKMRQETLERPQN
ncbi:hypothetical protein [Paraburkholderia flava]|uniref:hypothetical protein n=1 Tax=Paraburkholderia flava TaxID=2547393 RepID=UPI001060179D|nr:hypothetical protein [Paraburkholderia flava]